MCGGSDVLWLASIADADFLENPGRSNKVTVTFKMTVTFRLGKRERHGEVPAPGFRQDCYGAQRTECAKIACWETVAATPDRGDTSWLTPGQIFASSRTEVYVLTLIVPVEISKTQVLESSMQVVPFVTMK